MKIRAGRAGDQKKDERENFYPRNHTKRHETNDLLRVVSRGFVDDLLHLPQLFADLD